MGLGITGPGSNFIGCNFTISSSCSGVVEIAKHNKVIANKLRTAASQFLSTIRSINAIISIKVEI
jgi:hypothetical protein